MNVCHSLFFWSSFGAVALSLLGRRCSALHLREFPERQLPATEVPAQRCRGRKRRISETGGGTLLQLTGLTGPTPARRAGQAPEAS